MFRAVKYISRQAAESLRGDANVVMVSINEPGGEPARLMGGFAAVLRIAFWDVNTPHPVTREYKDESFVYTPITTQQAQEIAEFPDRWHAPPDGPELLIVHCRAGVSRSAAVARFAAERYGIELAQNAELANAEVLRKLRQAVGMVPTAGEEK